MPCQFATKTGQVVNVDTPHHVALQQELAEANPGTKALLRDLVQVLGSLRLISEAQLRVAEAIVDACDSRPVDRGGQ